MEKIRTGSRIRNFRSGWLTALRHPNSRSSQRCATVRLRQLSRKPAQAEAEPSVVDFLDVNGELTYTTVLEGLEEFLYQQEMQTGSRFNGKSS